MGGSSASSKGLEDSKANRYEAEMKILKKERDEFFASRFDKVSNPGRANQIKRNHFLQRNECIYFVKTMKDILLEEW